MPTLSTSQVQQFKDDGYLVIPDFYNQHDVASMLNRAKELISEFDPETHPMTAFTTGDDGKHVGDEYFLDSANKISFFLEPSSLSHDPSQPSLPPKLIHPPSLSINKIGHALSVLDPTFRHHTMENQKIKDVAREIDQHEDPRVLQSMIICKQPRIGGKVPIHNDSTFLYTDPPSAIGFWIALEDCTSENGALSFLPGSHRRNTITSRFVRLPEGGTGFISLPSADESDAKVNWEKEEGWREEGCKAGSLVLIHGAVQHTSPPNHSEKTRFIYTFHMIDGSDKHVFDDRNWLQPLEGGEFEKLFVE